MSDRALILSGDLYEVADEKTGEIKPLYQIWYINDYRENTAKEIGSKPIKTLTTKEIFDKLQRHVVPGVYDMHLKSRPGKANAAALMLVDFDFVRDPKLFDDVPVKAKAA